MIITCHKKIMNVAVYPAMKQTAMMVFTRLTSRKLLTLKLDLWKFIFIDRARTHIFPPSSFATISFVSYQQYL